MDEELHNRVDSIVIDMNQNVRAFLASVRLPEVNHNQTRAAALDSASP